MRIGPKAKTLLRLMEGGGVLNQNGSGHSTGLEARQSRRGLVTVFGVTASGKPKWQWDMPQSVWDRTLAPLTQAGVLTPNLARGVNFGEASSRAGWCSWTLEGVSSRLMDGADWSGAFICHGEGEAEPEPLEADGDPADGEPADGDSDGEPGGAGGDGPVDHFAIFSELMAGWDQVADIGAAASGDVILVGRQQYGASWAVPVLKDYFSRGDLARWPDYRLELICSEFRLVDSENRTVFSCWRFTTAYRRGYAELVARV